jgi:transcriptional regulator
MYLPEHFQQTDREQLYGLIEQSPFGILVTASATGLEANHLPFELDRDRGEHGSLFCHVARSNKVWQSEAALETALAIFQGPSTYISPSLYASKQETHMVVPTYNYVAVHVTGRLIVHDDVRAVRGLVARLTRHFEKDREVPWKMGDAPAAFIEERLKHIVGLEIEIIGITGKWKMSQNRSPADQQSVITRLATGSTEEKAVADVMTQIASRKSKTPRDSQ